jgi:hypothetical protein
LATLTESMARLHAEIVCQRLRRQAFRHELVRRTEARRDWVSGLRGAFARDRAGAQAAWSAPSRAAAPVETAAFVAPPQPLAKTFPKNRKKRR